MTRACLALLAGLFAPQLSSFSQGVIVIVALALILAVFRRWCALACFLAGAGLFIVTAFAVIDSRIAHEFEGDSILATVRVVDFPKTSGASVSLLLQPVDDARLPGRLRVSWYEPPRTPVFAEVWQMELRLRRPRGSSNPGVFDYETWLFQQKIGATGYVVPGVRNRLLHPGKPSGINKFRTHVADRITESVDDRQAAAVLVAIAVGARHLLSAEQWERYAISGTSHLMAISGLHVGLAAASAYVLLSAFLAVGGFRHCNRDIAMTGALCVAALYVAVSGFAVPAQRALVMLTLGATAFLRRRQLRAAPLLAAACVAVVITDPLATMSAGFKLSFAAVAVLLWLGKRHDGGRHRLYQLASMQLTLLFGLAPLTAIIFQRVALLAPPVNLVAVPIFSFVTVPTTLTAIVLGWDWLLRVAAFSVQWVEELISLVARTPLAGTSIAGTVAGTWFLLACCLAWAVLPPGWPGRHVAWLALIGVLSWRPDPVPFGCADVTVLDVGQGLAAAVRTNRYVLLYDTGPAYRGGGSAADRVIVPWLRSRGISRVDAIVVSHADLDHIGGLPAVAAAMDVGETWSSEASGDGRLCRRGAEWTWDGIRFSFLHPGEGGQTARNDGSCVLLVEAGRYSMLFTGDIEAAAETRLVQLGLAGRTDVVTVPHHGSRTSSSQPFVARLAPELAIVAAGYRNRWGFPKPDVVARWREQGTKVLETSVSGALAFPLCQRSGVGPVRFQREAQRRIWYEP